MIGIKHFIYGLVLLLGIDASAVSFITKCDNGDTKCVTASTQAAIPKFAAGIPEYGVKRLDNIPLESVDASVGDLKLLLKDVAITGLEKCKALEVNARDLKLIVKLSCDVTAKGQYEAGGKVTLLPIEGKGEIRATFNDLNIQVDLDLKEMDGIDGKKHWNIESYKPKFEFKGKSNIELDNLFDGNEKLAGAIKELLKVKGNEVVTEVAPPIIEAVVKEVVQNVNNFYHAVPKEDLRN